MPLGYLEKIMGGGKTLFTALYARRWSHLHPNGMIYCNYVLNLPNAVFTPYMFMGLSKLRKSRNSLIIIDDFHAYKNMKQFSLIIANLSRKLGMEIILTVQDWTMVPAIMRRLSTYKIVPSYSKNYDTLFLKFLGQRGHISMPTLIFEKPIQRIVIPEKLYNTNEIVGVPTERRVIPEILKFSENIDDLEDNLFLYTANKAERERLMKKLSKKKGLYTKKSQKQQQNYCELYILNKLFNVSFDILSLKFGISKTKIWREVNRIKFEIKERNLDIIKKK